VTEIANLFEWLNGAHGINLSVMYDSFDRANFLAGMRYTLWLSVVSILGSILIGGIGAYCLFLKHRSLHRLVNTYVQVFRNTPPLIQLYFFYFALGPALTSATGLHEPVLSNVTWAIVSLTFYAGSFNVEIFRSGIEAVPASTLEAADALGMGRAKIFYRIVMPLALRISLPALNNNFVNLIKTSSNAFAIAVPEILYASSQIWSDHLNTLEMMCILFAFYSLLIGCFVFMMHRIEKAVSIPGWGRA
jgi:polar amino acid transport system permease protein